MFRPDTTMPDRLARALRAEAERHRGLAADLDALAAGTGPTPAQLAEAPVLQEWRLVPSATARMLVGRVIGHPLLGTTSMRSSDVVAFDPTRGVARTLSRWYVLGEPDAETAGRDPVRG